MARTSDAEPQFTLLYFASASAFTGKSSERFTAPLSLNELFGKLEHQYPDIGAKVLGSSALTVNLEYIDLEADASRYIIKGGDEVAIIPPVSSG